MSKKINMGLSIGYSSDPKYGTHNNTASSTRCIEQMKSHTVYKWIMGKYIVGYCCYRMSRKGMRRAMHSGTILLLLGLKSSYVIIFLLSIGTVRTVVIHNKSFCR